MTRRRLKTRRVKGSHHYATTSWGQQPMGVGTVTLNDDVGEPIGLRAIALIGAQRVSFYQLHQQLSERPCAVVQLAEGATVFHLAEGYEDRLSRSKTFLAGFAAGLYQAFEHLADVKQGGQHERSPRHSDL